MADFERPRLYLACPNRGKGDVCSMLTTIPLKEAKEVVLDFVGNLLTSWPDWLQRAAASMRWRFVPGQPGAGGGCRR